MRWEDERYVRLYTRKTVTWKLLPWQGKALLPLLLREVDRAGILNLDAVDPVEAVSVMTEMPTEVVGPGLSALMRAGIISVGPSALVIPNFVDAQETTQTDAQRQNESREKRKAAGLVRVQSNGSDKWVSAENASVQVTAGHKVTEKVTEGHSSRAVPSVPNQPNHLNPLPPSGAAEVVDKNGPEPGELFPPDKKAHQKPQLTPPTEPEPEVDEVMAYYLEALTAQGKRAHDTPKGRSHIRARIAEGSSVAECKLAIDGLTYSDHHLKGGFTGIKYALRSKDQLVMMIERVPPEEQEAI